MSGDFPFTTKIVSPLKCNEKPWDLWVSEIGHLSPQRDNDGTFTTPAAVDSKSSSSRRVHEAHPYKVADRGQARYRRAGLNRLKYESMSLHGLFPQMDNLNAAVCHMCGVIVKCSAAYRHLLESHSGSEPLLPPPPPTVKLKSALSRSRHKKEPPPTFPVDIHPVKMETSPVHTAAAPKSRLVLPQPDLQYLEEASTSSAITGEVQVSVESGELPVVSIQDDLPLGENLTDDILAIMNSEGIQSADDITIAADWKNIIKDIHDINFPSATDTLQSQDLYGASLDSSLSGYAIADTDLGNITFQSNSSPLISNVVESSIQNAQALKPTPATSKTKTQPRKSSKSKLKQREYDPNKHCGVFCVETLQPCTRSLTCKSHALSLRRTVEGRSKSFDTLLAEHRASKDAAAAELPSDASLLNLTSPTQTTPSIREEKPEGFSNLAHNDVCWYSSSPRPLALCTFNASHAGSAVTLGKKFATVRSNIKSSLTRSTKSFGVTNNFFNHSMSLSKTLHINSANKTNKPEVRKLIVTCSANNGPKEVQQTLSDLFGSDVRHTLNGHLSHMDRKPRAGSIKTSKRPSTAVLDLGFSMDPLLADEKC
ncbi:unnamed protein product [Leptidea sinapis]|uniref:SCA7 domain-containing protein n=1 Tax=Leptidea sinapis TaxID=189913 RepID=A0A5E4PMH0_9NEOP|nr:unnamed protein product [Leptidea sinapis]